MRVSELGLKAFRQRAPLWQHTCTCTVLPDQVKSQYLNDYLQNKLQGLSHRWTLSTMKSGAAPLVFTVDPRHLILGTYSLWSECTVAQISHPSVKLTPHQITAPSFVLVLCSEMFTLLLAFPLPCRHSLWPCLSFANCPLHSGQAWSPLCAQLMVVPTAQSWQELQAPETDCWTFIPVCRPGLWTSRLLCLIFLTCRNGL